MSHWDNADPLVRKLVNLKVHDKDWVSVAQEEGYRAAKFMEWGRTRRILRELRDGGQPYIADRFENGMRLGAMDRRAMLKSSIGGSWAETKAKFGRDARKKAKARKKRRSAKVPRIVKRYWLWVYLPLQNMHEMKAVYRAVKKASRGLHWTGSGGGFGEYDTSWEGSKEACQKAAKLVKALRLKGLRLKIVDTGKDGKGHAVIHSFGKRGRKPKASLMFVGAAGAAKLGAKASKKFVLMYNMSGNYTRHKMKFVKSKKTGEIARFATFAQAWMVAKNVSAKDKAPYFYVTTPTSGVVAVLRRGKGKKVKS